MAYSKLRGYKRRMKNIESQVPKGHYCYGYREDGEYVTCPFWKLNKHLDKQENGICLAFNYRDGIDTSLLWDMVKSCDINDEVSEYKLSEEDCIMIIDTEPMSRNESNAADLSNEEQLKRAREILTKFNLRR